MTRRLAMLHTGPVVIPTLADLARRHLPGIKVVHLLDDTIVADIEAAGGTAPTSVLRRLELLGRAGVEAGAEAVMVTCSSISEATAGMQEALGVPVHRIDEAMADQAVATGRRIGVVATLPTTLRPTCALIAERATLAGVEVELSQVLAREAFELVSAGDGEGHDRVLREVVTDLAADVDVVVLAQASMARAVESLDVPVPVLSSPELGVLRVRDHLATTGPLGA